MLCTKLFARYRLNITLPGYWNLKIFSFKLFTPESVMTGGRTQLFLALDIRRGKKSYRRLIYRPVLRYPSEVADRPGVAFTVHRDFPMPIRNIHVYHQYTFQLSGFCDLRGGSSHRVPPLRFVFTRQRRQAAYELLRSDGHSRRSD